MIDSKDLKCKNCEERYVGCHAKCESYLEWKRQNDIALKQQQEHREKMRIIYKYARRKIK